MLTRNNVILSCVGMATMSLGMVPAAIASLDRGRTDGNETSAYKTGEIMSSDAVPQTTCKLALMAQAENSVVYGQEKVIGRVYNVIGNNVYMELDNGSTYIANLTIWERGKLGNIIGRRIVVTPYYCNRANLDTTLYFTPATPIPVPPLVFSSPTTSIPPLTPREDAPVRSAPVEVTPAPQPAEIIPQTW